MFMEGCYAIHSKAFKKACKHNPEIKSVLKQLKNDKKVQRSIAVALKAAGFHSENMFHWILELSILARYEQWKKSLSDQLSPREKNY